MKMFENQSKLGALAAAIVVTLAFALGGGFTGQVTAAPPQSSHPFAVGGFTATDLSQVAFAAQINPQDSSRYSGHVVQTDAWGVSRHGPVTCVVVSPPCATIVWRVAHSDNSSEVGQYRSFEVVDGGEPPAGADMYKDRMCDSTCGPDGNGLWQPVIRGNIVVKGP